MTTTMNKYEVMREALDIIKKPVDSGLYKDGNKVLSIERTDRFGNVINDFLLYKGEKTLLKGQKQLSRTFVETMYNLITQLDYINVSSDMPKMVIKQQFQVIFENKNLYLNDMDYIEIFGDGKEIVVRVTFNKTDYYLSAISKNSFGNYLLDHLSGILFGLVEKTE